MNLVMLNGRLGIQPTLKKFDENDGAVTTFDVAVNSYNKKNNTKYTTWIHCKAWNNIAKNICDFAKVGYLINLQGHIDYDDYTKDEQNIHKCYVIVDKFSIYKTSKLDDDEIEVNLKEKREMGGEDNDEEMPFEI